MAGWLRTMRPARCELLSIPSNAGSSSRPYASEFGLGHLHPVAQTKALLESVSLVSAGAAVGIKFLSGRFAMRRVAIVHECIAGYFGSERVLEQILRLYPTADVFCVADFVPPNERAFLNGTRVT